MPAVNPRITITLTPTVHAILKRLSSLTGNSQSAIVSELLQSSHPVFERMVSVLEAADRLKAEGMQAPAQVRDSLEAVQANLERQLGLALEESGLSDRPLLDEVEKVPRRGPGRRKGGVLGAHQPAARAARSAEPPISNRGVTPHPSRAKTARKSPKEVSS